MPVIGCPIRARRPPRRDLAESGHRTGGASLVWSPNSVILYTGQVANDANLPGLTDADIENLARHALAQSAELAAEHYADLDDYELILASGADPASASATELNRRLKVAVRELSDISIKKLTEELKNFHESSDRLAARVVVLNLMMLLMTSALVFLAIRA
jgi:hypothetical protein